MTDYRLLGGALALACFPMTAPTSAAADDAVALPTLAITAPEGSLTVPGVEAQRAALNKIAGGVGFVDSEEFKDRYANNLRDVLKDTPGVFVQNRYGQELRLSVRGSGLARGFHTRGIEVLQDGIPTNLADGSGDFYQIDPLALRAAEIYKGGNALPFGAGTLGGAVNFTTPTAQTAIAPNIARLEGGSFGTVRANAQMSRSFGKADALGNLTLTRADNFRDHEYTRAAAFNANAGYRFSPDVETRFYGGTFATDQQLPGALSLRDALDNPRMASAAALAGDQRRDSRTWRIANRTSFTAPGGQVDIDSWAIHKDLFHPIFQVIDQDGTTYGISPHYGGSFRVGGFKNDLLAGLRYFAGSNQARQYVNVAGSRGAQTLDTRQDAFNYEAYLEDRFWFVPQAAFTAGAKLFRDERRYEDHGGLVANPARKQDAAVYDGVNPKFGLLWQPQDNIQAFIDIARSQDVPDFTDLTQTTAATTRFVPLRPQDAWTLEFGTRGEAGRYGWDITFYRAWIRDELLQFTTDPNVPASTFNAGRTRHQGVELAASADLLRGVEGMFAGDALLLKQVWTYNDFRFRGDRQYGDNRIAGAPEHVLRTELAYKHHQGFYVTPAVDWVPQGAYADQANRLRAPGYALFGLQAGVEMENGLLLYLDGRNLTDERYVSDISTVTDARTANTAVFYPGDGRSLFAGLRYAF